MSAKLTGGCLCGQVRFEVDGDAGPFFLCHCSHCRKDTGSAHAANLFMAPGRLDWLAGQDRVTRFDLPGTRHSRCFCSACGSALPYERPGGAGLVVPAGTTALLRRLADMTPRHPVAESPVWGKLPLLHG